MNFRLALPMAGLLAAASLPFSHAAFAAAPNSGSIYAQVMPTESQLPAGYSHGGEAFLAYGEDIAPAGSCDVRVCDLSPEQRWYEVKNIVDADNAQAAIDDGIVDGARSFGFVCPEFCQNPGAPSYWAAAARFKTVAGARAFAAGYIAQAFWESWNYQYEPRHITGETTVSGLGDLGARHTTGYNAYELDHDALPVSALRVTQLSFSRGTVAVVVWVQNTPESVAFRLAGTIDGNLVLTHFGQPPTRVPLHLWHYFGAAVAV